ncbi:N-acetylglucosamine-6-phosphate deacetylase [Capillibacterium thermochitinicola]|uniref:N-acetylglucosamine-6-phosphate deacetylase n=1 Tax=Capillibacterium thermochitinicola TaxID=2699427 RepID=A0A8J6I3A3_9FIRM|nr:N-acetylglucosamine-6-phosphate deacetylase [Capillibacterium thermochitinicola]MBA2133884.1 N-acetylglucosamine-6-phosphate deacetylase [Capillibacterium thermochitinicola]
MKAIKNIRLITTEGIKEGQAVVYDQTIREVLPEKELPAGCTVMDGGGAYLSAGFIDLHIHGCAGYDTMDEDDRALKVIADRLVATGVTAFLPTTMTMDRARIERALDRIAAAMSGAPGQGAQVLGCNLEGPFLSPENKGAHDERYMIGPDFAWIRPYLGVIRVLTVAPELEGALDFIRQLVAAGVVVSIGHTKATYEEAAKGIAAGASLITHLFNAMTPLHHRQPGVVGAALSHPVACEVIADNIHSVPEIHKLLVKIKPVTELVLVTDAMRACLLADGTYDLGGMTVHVKEGQARLESGTLAGSTLVMNVALRNFYRNTGLPLAEIVKMATLNPARILRLADRKGSIAPGKDADLVLWDEDFNVLMTIVAGETVFTGRI